MALSHILQVMVLVCSLRVPMEAQEIVFHILQVQMEDLGIVFRILRVQMAVLVKVVFHSLERTDFFHIQQAHLCRHIARDDLLDDSLERTGFFRIQQAHLCRHVARDDLQEDSR